LAPNETRSMKITFNFLVDELSEKKEFYYHFIQRDNETEDIIGAKMFKIVRGSSNLFDADAGQDKEIDKNESVTLSATDINEPATYNWYDLDGNLISSGKDITLSPDITQKYKLEVITTSDGFKDYDEINVEVNPFVLGVMSPNPADNQVTINYLAEDSTSAYLVLSELNTNNTNNYILNPSENTKTLDLSNYNTGIYFVSFVCDGVFVASATLVVQ
ncbi:MAG: hypothetical protein ACI9M9_001996, partial [Flavobacteriaceae bacterium]